jgi:hypothetical protein
MRASRLACTAVLAATAVLAFGAATASSGATVGPHLATAATAAPQKVAIRYTVKKFVRHGNHLVAYGRAYAKYRPASGAPKTTSRAFTAAVAVRGRHLSAAQRICPILDLTLAPLDLNLLGLMIHLDQVHLTITANSNGGVLGSLLCGLTNGGRLTAQTVKLNWVVQQSGLSSTGAGFVVGVQPQPAAGGPGSTPKVVRPAVICTVLDLTVGPLDLNLLGLMVHLDRVHLLITADSNGGLLGGLLCPGIAGGG